MFTLFFTICALVVSTQAHAQLLPPPTAGEYELRGEFNYYTTSSNYDSGGTRLNLDNGSSLTTMMGTGEFVFDWTQQWRVRAGFYGGQTSAHRYNGLSGSTEDHTNIGVSEAWAGAEYWFEAGAFDLVPEAQLTYPFFRVSESSGDPLLGEGAMRLRGGAWAIYESADWRPFGYLGYEYMDEGRASDLPYHLGVQWAPQTSTWWLQGELRGFFNMTSDSNTDASIERLKYLADVQGGSERFYSLNPTQHEVAALVGTHFGQFGIYGGAAYAYMGKNTAVGTTFTVGVTFDGSFFLPTPQRRSIEHRFKPQAEKYDSTLFDTTPVPPKEVVRPMAAPTPAPKKVVKKKAAAQPMPTVELILKDTEKSLEKKQKEQ